MNVRLLLTVALAALLVSPVVESRDDRLRFPVAEAMQTEDARDKLDPDIRYFWGDQSHPEPMKRFGEFTANRKTNAFNKSDKAACQHAFLSAMLSLQDRALREGGNAVVNIHSVYRNKRFDSRTEFECGAGRAVAGVALRGTVVKLP